MVKKVLALGEILLRLSPPMYQTLTQTSSLDCQFGGSELNVLSTLAQLGYDVSIITAIPDNEVGHMAETFLFGHQIGQENIVKTGERLGVYYYQKGFSLRSSVVTYDRKYSSFYESKVSDYDIDTALDGVDWFHVSGITAALNENLYQLTYQMMLKAKEKSIPISFDLNYRATLWESFDQAREQLSKLVKLADVCVGLEPLNLLDENGLDIKDKAALKPPYTDIEQLKEIVAQLADVYQLTHIAFTQREMSYNNEYVLKAYLYHDGTLYETSKENIQVLDRVGTGDAFTAGIICGLLDEKSGPEVLDIAMASFKFKHTIDGDINIVSRRDIERLMNKESFEIKR